MAIEYAPIRTGIRTIVLALSAIPDEDHFAWENRDFDPPKEDIWVRETFLPGSEFQIATGLERATGIAQYDVNYPAGKGSEIPSALADAIKNAFPTNTTVLDASGVSAEVYRSERLAASNDNVWYTIPVRLSWRAHGFS